MTHPRSASEGVGRQPATAELQGPSWRELVAAKVAEKCLFYLGKRAWDRGDKHDYDHALGALNAGACGIGCDRDRT